MADPTRPRQASRLTRHAALEVLGLSEPVSAREITRAYRRLAKTTHPDLAGQPDRRTFPEPSSREAGRRFASLTDAYRALIDTPATSSTEATPTPTPSPRESRSAPVSIPVRIRVRVRVTPTTAGPPIIAGPVHVTRPAPPG